MNFSIKDFLGKCDQTRNFLQIWLHLLNKSLMANFIFFAVPSIFPDSGSWNQYSKLKLYLLDF